MVIVMKGEFIPMTRLLVRPLCQISEFRRIVGLEICFVQVNGLRVHSVWGSVRDSLDGFQGGSRLGWKESRCLKWMFVSPPSIIGILQRWSRPINPSLNHQSVLIGTNRRN